MRQRHSHFTLVELLIAIGIIVILSAILVPTTINAIKKAEMTKAKAQAVALVNAIKQYELTYGKLPVEYFSSEKIKGTGDYTYKGLITMLQAEPKSGTEYYPGNPRKIKFLDVQGGKPGVYQDPWDQDFIIYIDHNGDGKIGEVPKGVTLESGQQLFFSVVVWSIGADEDESGFKDNVYSFPVIWEKDIYKLSK